jgi:hypothetical protein
MALFLYCIDKNHQFNSRQVELDSDYQVFVELLSNQDEPSFVQGKLLFNEGGHSASYAVLNIGWRLRRLNAGATVIGKSSTGADITGTLIHTAGWFATKIYVRYNFASDSSKCQVGRLIETDTAGCK